MSLRSNSITPREIIEFNSELQLEDKREAYFRRVWKRSYVIQAVHGTTSLDVQEELEFRGHSIKRVQPVRYHDLYCYFLAEEPPSATSKRQRLSPVNNPVEVSPTVQAETVVAAVQGSDTTDSDAIAQESNHSDSQSSKSNAEDSDDSEVSMASDFSETTGNELALEIEYFLMNAPLCSNNTNHFRYKQAARHIEGIVAMRYPREPVPEAEAINNGIYRHLRHTKEWGAHVNSDIYFQSTMNSNDSEILRGSEYHRSSVTSKSDTSCIEGNVDDKIEHELSQCSSSCSSFSLAHTAGKRSRYERRSATDKR